MTTTNGLTRSAKLTVTRLSTTHLVDDFYQGCIPALIPLFAAERGYSGLATGGLMFAGTFLSSLLQPGFGLLTDRIRMPWIMWAGMLLAGAGIAASGLGGTYISVWLAFTMAGVGVAAFHPEGARATREAAGSSAQAMSWFSVGGNIGLALAPVIATPIIARLGLGATPVLIIPGLILASGFVMAIIRRSRHTPVASPPASRRGSVTVGPESDAEESAAESDSSTSSENSTPSENSAPAGEPRRGTGRGLGDDWASFTRLMIVIIMRSISYASLSTFFILSLEQRFGLSTSAAAPALATFLITGACGTLLGGWLADHYGRIRVLRAGYLIGILGITLIAVAPTLTVSFIAAFLSGVGLYLPFAIHTTLGQDLLPTKVATAAGMTTGFAISVGGMMAPVMGAIADASSYRIMFAILISAPAIAFGVSLTLRDPMRRR